MILLDTHVILWLGYSPERLTKRAVEAIRRVETNGEILAVSSVSLFELSYVMLHRRVYQTIPYAAFLSSVQQRFRVTAVTAEIALCAGQLAAPFHGDPLDRLITATAMVENCALMTADAKILKAGLCKTIW